MVARLPEQRTDCEAASWVGPKVGWLAVSQAEVTAVAGDGPRAGWTVGMMAVRGWVG